MKRARFTPAAIVDLEDAARRVDRARPSWGDKLNDEVRYAGFVTSLVHAILEQAKRLPAEERAEFARSARNQNTKRLFVFR